MKHLFKTLLVLLLISISTNSFAMGWIRSFEDAQKLALAQNKLIIVDFWASWCGPCLKMDREVWGDSEVQSIMQSFIPVKIDIDLEKSFAHSYGVNAIPDIFIMDGNGEVIYHHKGSMDKNDLLRELKKYDLNTSFLTRPALQFYRNSQYNTALDLAEHYMDFAINIPIKETRSKFLNVAESYLEKSEDLLLKDMKTYNLFKERIALYDLIIEIYRGRANKVARILERDFTNIKLDERNKGPLLFLKSCLCDPNDPILADLSKELSSVDHTGSFKTRLKWFAEIED